MVAKKILRVSLYFVLPDKFDGTFNDALTLAAKHLVRKTRKGEGKDKPVSGDVNLWPDFLETMRSNKKLVANYCLAVWKYGQYLPCKRMKNGKFRWSAKKKR